MKARKLIWLVPLMLVFSCNPTPMKGSIPSINITPFPGCVGEPMTLNGIFFPAKAASVYVQPQPESEAILLGVVHPNPKGEWVLTVQVEPHWVRVDGMNPNATLIVMTDDGTQTIHQSVLIENCTSTSPSPSASTIPGTKIDSLSQRARPLLEEADRFRAETQSYPPDARFFTEVHYPPGIAYRRLADGSGYELTEILPTGEPGCVYSSKTRAWSCP